MDPLTQGALGAALPLATRRRAGAVAAGALGFVAGMAADLDVLIRSDLDTLLYLQYHRQFTHSLIFIPVGALITAAVLYLPFRRWMGISFLTAWLFCALGYGTHGLLDAATSYGTVLFWPFSDTRVAWSIISIIDPLFTLPVLALAVTGMIRRNGRWAVAALAWAAVYLSLGVWQHQNARAMGADLAASRGHTPLRMEVKPSFGNLLVWKVIYATPDRYYVDAVRAGYEPRVYPGASIARLVLARDFPWLDPAWAQARDIERFRHFSDGFIARDPDRSDRIIDLRYSLSPNQIAALWSIRLDPDGGPDAHARFETHRGDARRRLAEVWRMLWEKEGG
ncbi:MAG TPA: metal-dependent hydrolase [Rhodospirillaceae bacterium]|nr:metal-dependent hydrolase [Rhodospirillaceae bacterium]